MQRREMNTEFVKMHGTGNSYILIEDLYQHLEHLYSHLAVILSDKNYGIGSDGLLIINKGNLAPLRMRVFNPDGNEAEMCGNGIRMFARYVWDKGTYRKKEIQVEVGGKEGGRIVVPKLNFKNEEVCSVTVDMDKGRFLEENKKVKLVDTTFEGSHVSVGNPHFVVFVENPTEKMARQYGPQIENHEDFKPSRTNVEFAEIQNPNSISVHVWERGAGYTLSCGTGACAVALAAHRLKKTNEDMKIHLPGGDLDVSVLDGDRISMKGPAEYIFEGSIDSDRLLSSGGAKRLYDLYGV